MLGSIIIAYIMRKKLAFLCLILAIPLSISVYNKIKNTPKF